MRAGFFIPPRQNIPPQAALLTFVGDHSHKHALQIIAREGWTLHAGAMAAHLRYLHHFAQEFLEHDKITRKELALIGAGLQNKQTADRLNISLSAVRQRLQALQEKSRGDLAALAISLGVLPDPVNRPDNASEPLVESDKGLAFSPD